MHWNSKVKINKTQKLINLSTIGYIMYLITFQQITLYFTLKFEIFTWIPYKLPYFHAGSLCVVDFPLTTATTYLELVYNSLANFLENFGFGFLCVMNFSLITLNFELIYEALLISQS